MLNLNDNVRVRVLDKNNYTFDKYKEVENQKTKEKSSKWVQVGGYYGKLDQCLNALKNYLVNEEIESKDFNIDELLAYIDQLNNSFVKCVIKVEENE